MDGSTILIYHGGMEPSQTITMDAAGRLIIPAAIRRELALVGGAELLIDVQGGTIQLRPTAKAAVANRGGRLVVRSALTGPVPDHREIREERSKRIAGE